MKLNNLLILSLTTFVAIIGAKQSSPTRGTLDNAPHLIEQGFRTLTVSSRSVHGLTNAERLQRGIPLLAPRKPSRVAVRAAAPSPTVCGRLMVEDVKGVHKGYISATLDSQGRFFVTPNRADAIEVVHSRHRLIPMNAGLIRPVVGAAFGDMYQTPPGANAFDVGSYNFAILSSTSETLYGSPASPGLTSYTGASANGIESAIFRLDHQHGNEIIPTWINPDGNPERSSFVVPSGDTLQPVAITGSAAAYAAMFGGYAARVFCDAS